MTEFRSDALVTSPTKSFKPELTCAVKLPLEKHLFNVCMDVLHGALDIFWPSGCSGGKLLRFQVSCLFFTTFNFIRSDPVLGLSKSTSFDARFKFMSLWILQHVMIFFSLDATLLEEERGLYRVLWRISNRN